MSGATTVQVHYAGGKVVGDASLGASVADEHGGTLSYPYWLRVTEVSPGHAVTASLNELLFVEPVCCATNRRAAITMTLRPAA